MRLEHLARHFVVDDQLLDVKGVALCRRVDGGEYGGGELQMREVLRQRLLHNGRDHFFEHVGSLLSGSEIDVGADEAGVVGLTDHLGDLDLTAHLRMDEVYLWECLMNGAETVSSSHTPPARRRLRMFTPCSKV